MYGRSDVLINHVLLDRVLEIKQRLALHDGALDNEDLIEQIKLTRLAEMAESLSEEEVITIVLIATQNYPEIVLQILMEEILINKERTKRKNGKDSKNV